MAYRLIHRLEDVAGLLLEVGAIGAFVENATDNRSGLIYAGCAMAYIIGRNLRNNAFEKKLGSRIEEEVGERLNERIAERKN